MPVKFIVKNILFGATIYGVGFFVLSHFSRNIYFDFLVYGGICFLLYMCFFGLIFKELKGHMNTEK